MGYHPYHFWGMAGSLAPVSSACNTLLPKWSWQDADHVGREELRVAIAQAEDRMTSVLGFSPAPHQVTEVVTWPQGLLLGSDGRAPAVELQEGEIRSIGTETLTLLGSPVVAYSDADGDGLKETFVVTQATTETNPDRIAVYFSAADRLDSADAGPDWRIEPVTVTISGGVATIRGKTWLLVDPIRYEGMRWGPLDPSDIAMFVTTLDVMTRTIDQTTQATLVWESLPWPAGCTLAGSGSPTDPAAVGTTTGRVGIRDAIYGLVTVGAASYDVTTATWSSDDASWRPPDRVEITYQAGLALVRGQMAPMWQTAVARLAAAELTRRICACDAANRELYTWQADLARTSQDEVMGAISPDDLRNPFGTRRGHIAAWKQCLGFAHVSGVLV